MKSINLIKLILKEELSKILNEDITSGSAIVYHRTGKDGNSPIEGIASDGFRAGSGAMYGIGVYTTYNLQSQLNSNMYQYGNIIIECKVNSLDKFLIFDYNIAKKVYRNKNHTLDKQLQLILGKEWKDYKDNEILKTLIEKLPVVKYTSEIAKSFYDEFKDTIVNKLRGIIFTGNNDGNVLVSYDRRNVEPIRYSEDEGKTWINLLNKTIYQRIKDYNPKEDITYNRVLNNLQTGELSKYDVEYIENNLELFYNKIKSLNSFGIYNLLNYSKNPDEIAKLIINAKGNNLDLKNIELLLKKSQTPDELAKLIGIDKVNKALSLLDSDQTILTLKNSKNKSEMIELIINAKDSSLDPEEVFYFIDYASDKDLIIDRIINVKGNKISSSDIYEFLESTSDKDAMIKKIINIKGDKLNSSDIKHLLENSSNQSETFSLILNAKKNKFEFDDIYELLKFSEKPSEIVKFVGLDKLNKGLIRLYSSAKLKLISSSKNPVQIAKLIGIDEVNKDLLGLNTSKIIDLIEFAYKKYEMAKLIINAKGRTLDSDSIKFLLAYSSNKDKLANIIINAKTNTLNSNDIFNLIQLSDSRLEIASRIINVKNNELNSDDIFNLLLFFVDKSKVKNLLIKAGVDKSLIPN
jgi:hypothetical protein